jgi:short-subunit dehydrogenase
MEKIALITGASKGIGKALAHVFAKQGYSLILTARNTFELEELSLNLKNKYQCTSKIISADLSKPDGVGIIMDAIKDDVSKVHVLINNAGFGIAKKLTDISSVDIAGMVEVNIAALTKLTFQILPFMVAQKSGKILNVSSIAAFGPGPYMSIYYATKAYVLCFSQGIREEYKKDGVSVSVLCPGFTKTEFQKRAGTEDLHERSGKMMPLMTAEKVADIAYQGLMQDKCVIVPGIFNKILRCLMWLFPDWLIAKITSGIQNPQKR